MCGICGRYNFQSQAPVDEGLLERMCAYLVHRGPDGEGVHTEGALGFGHRRLAVIDLTEAGSQPMCSEDERLWITYNGEVYNFRELRADLEQRGHRFRSRTDSEVILAAYREFGVKCVDRLRGMFAFALWDREQRSLFLARDRLGKKPLFYSVDRNGITFASEPRAFLADPDFSPSPDPEAISHYLTYQYVPNPLCAFQGVKKIQPGHYLLIQDGRVHVERYWKLRYREKLNITEDEACEELVDRLREAVRLRLVSDVPLGAFLSGGVDSSAVVALMTETGTSAVKTFSIGFEEKEYDELSYARQVAKQYGTDHQEFIVRPDAVEIIPKLVWHYGEPYADSSAIPTYYLARLARQYVTVALNGDAGDENFAGYERYRAVLLADRIAQLPSSLRSGLKAAVRCLPAFGGARGFLSRAKRFFATVSEDPRRRYAHWISHFPQSLKQELCTAEFLRATEGVDSEERILDIYRGSEAPDLLDATLDVDVNTYLPDDLLVKVDIATMAHGLEGRSPLLDHEFMEFCASLPSSFKLRGREKKFIFKRAIRKYLPAEILDRPKMGFGVPLDHWFRQDLREMTYDVLLSSTAMNRGYFQRETVERLLQEHVQGIRTWHFQIWNLLMLEMWHRMFIDERPEPVQLSVETRMET